MYTDPTKSATTHDLLSRSTRRPIRLAGAGARCGLSAAALVIGAVGTTAVLIINLSGHVRAAPGERGLLQAEAPLSPLTGPQRAITCPLGAVNVSPGTDIQRVVAAHPGRTTFCLKAGVHTITSAITPKTDNTFVGEYGAVLDGGTWTTTDGTQAAFLAHNQDVDYVTIRNLVIRNMPQRGIHAFYWMSDHWTIEYNEIAYNLAGVVFPPHSTIRNNYIHHNVGDPSSPRPAERGGGYMAALAHNTTFDSNEIAYNGPEQKVGESANVTFRNNFIHHNAGDGIWYDGDCAHGLVEGNRVEDNGRNGIFYEISTAAMIRNNTVERSGWGAVFISTSQGVHIYNNTLENNSAGIIYFLDCATTYGGYDLKNNSAFDNMITVGAETGAIASGFGHVTTCTPSELAPYLNGSKNLMFVHNTYRVPTPATGRYFFWDGLKRWNEWQSLRHDVRGFISRP